MNVFMRSSIDAIRRHGRDMTLTQISRVVDAVEGTVEETMIDHTVRMYPKSIKVTQYNYPDLIGKEVVVFYLANFELTFIPKVNDTVLFDNKVYVIRHYDFHEAQGVNCLYRLTGATG